MRIATTLVTVVLLAGAARAQDVGVFVTSSLHNGDFGGITAADAVCDDLGDASFPGSGPWVAWLSTTPPGSFEIHAINRIPFPGPGGAWVRAAEPGVIVADDILDLLSASLDNPVLRDEGGSVPPSEEVWTGTNSAFASSFDCGDWMTQASVGTVGLVTANNAFWTDFSEDDCSSERRLYCFGTIPAAGDSDADGDGVVDDLDVCADTTIPEGVPTRQLGVNRFALIDADGTFDTAPSNGRGPEKSFTIEDTAGCSCEQIIVGLELGRGHEKFGCSISAMEAWAALVGD